VMVAQDVPANQVDARLRQWAAMGRPDQVRDRVAHLLGVTPVDDQGQPVALALANFPTTEQLAAEAAAQAQVPVEVAQAAPVETPVALPAAPVQLAAAELPPVTAPVAVPVAVPAAAAAPPAPPILFAAPVVQPVTLASLEQPRPRVVSDAPAFASVSTKAASPVAAAAPRKFVAERGKAAQPGKGKGFAALAPKPVANGTHWVQLGSYTDPAVAKEGWSKFTRRTPALKAFAKVTTAATVDGTPVWRVAATGFANYDAAAKMCALVKQRGGACLVKRAEAGSPARLARR
jgi:hypothetical protein